MHPSPIVAQRVSTFTDYFKLNLDVEDVAAHFGYAFVSEHLALPRSAEPIAWYAELHARIDASLPYISLTSEIARREFLIAPVLLDLARHAHVRAGSWPIRWCGGSPPTVPGSPPVH
jgi:hypothetical protein